MFTSRKALRYIPARRRGFAPTLRRWWLVTLVAGLATLPSGIALAAEEFAFVAPQPGERKLQAQLTAQGVTDITVVADCPPAVVRGQTPPPCTYFANGAQGQQIAHFGTTPTSLVAKGRYRAGTLALLQQGAALGRNTTYFLMNHRGQRRAFADPAVKPIAAAVTKEEQLVAVTLEGLVVKSARGETVRHAPLPSGKVRYAAVGVNPEGLVAAIAIGEQNQILVSDTHTWQELALHLAHHGDRRGVLSVYPQSDKAVLAAVYRFVNSYNKGLIFAKVDFGANRVTEGHLFNSEQRNVGFDPDVYVEDGQVIVGATDASAGSPVFFSFPVAEADLIGERVPAHIVDFQNEETYSLSFGFGLSRVYWHSDSRVDDGGSTRARVDYEISPALFRSYQAEGRILNSRIAISYLEQEAQRKNELGSRVLNTLVDFNDLFAPSWDLRLLREAGRLEGVARFSDNGTAPFSEADKQTTVFRNTFTRYAAHVLFERGWFAGLESTNSTLPSAVGFANSDGDVLYTAYDPDLQIRATKFVFGYERLAYARRYEAAYRGFNFAGSMGLGTATASVSGKLSRAASEATGKSRPSEFSTGVFEFGGDVGYILQDRFKSLRGTGYQLSAGGRFKYTSYQVDKPEPQTDEEKQQAKKDKNKLFLKFQRRDFTYGPYVQFNMLF